MIEFYGPSRFKLEQKFVFDGYWRDPIARGMMHPMRKFLIYLMEADIEIRGDYFPEPLTNEEMDDLGNALIRSRPTNFKYDDE